MKQTDAEIRHAGRVVGVSGSQIKVQILTQTACSGCQAKAVCGASDGKTRIIPVRRPDDGKGGRGAHQVIPAGAHGRRYRMSVQNDLRILPGLRKPVFAVGIAADQAVVERGLNACVKRKLERCTVSIW